MARIKEGPPEGYFEIQDVGYVRILEGETPIMEHFSAITGLPCLGTKGVTVELLGSKRSLLVCGTCYKQGVFPTASSVGS